MSFLKIDDPAKRDLIVKEYLETKKNIRRNQLAEKTGEIELQSDLSRIFKPITKTQNTAAREITEGLKPIKEGIEQLPQRLPQQRTVIFKPTPTTSKEEEEEEERKKRKKRKKGFTMTLILPLAFIEKVVSFLWVITKFM